MIIWKSFPVDQLITSLTVDGSLEAELSMTEYLPSLAEFYFEQSPSIVLTDFDDSIRGLNRERRSDDTSSALELVDSWAGVLTGIPCSCGLSRRLWSSFLEASIFSGSAASTM